MSRRHAEQINVSHELQVARALAEKSRSGTVTYAVLFAFVVAVAALYPDRPREIVFCGTFTTLVVLLRTSLWRWAPPAEGNLFRWQVGFRLSAALCAFSWGIFSASTIRFYGLTPTSFAVLFPTAGIAAGSILSFAPCWSVMLVHLSLLLGPTIFSLVWPPAPTGGVFLATLTTIYLLYLVILAKKISRAFQEDLRKTNLILNQNQRLTDEKKKALSAAQAKERFLAMISHEVRTPLNGIVGISDVILNSQSDPLLVEQVESIRLSGENLLLILSDVLDFSEMMRGRLVFETIAFDFRQVINEVIALFATAAKRNGIGLRCSIDANVPERLVGDPDRVKQLLVNIVGNAIKFTERGEISVSISAREKAHGGFEIAFRVSDTGIGMDRERLERVFQFFRQGDEADNRKFGGIGIGLAVCKRICETMNGTISATSKTGVGTTFNFSLSLQDIGTLAPVWEIEPAEMPIGERRRVLVVEDNQTNQKLAVAMLKKAGCEVVLANNGLEALRVLEKETFSAIFMDCQMPEMDGYEATRKFRERDPLRRTPIIALTGNALEGDREKCLKAGMDDYLTKPIKYCALKTTLDKWTLAHEITKRAA